MTSNLKYKAVTILVVTLACIYWVIGLPKSRAELVANFQKNVRLGLDLKGGSHLVVQIQVQDAFKAEANTVMDRLKEEMTKAAITYASMERNDPATLKEADSIEIQIKGVPLEKTGAFRTLAGEVAPQWMLTAINASDYRLNIKASEALVLRRDTVERAVQSIEKRINGLGLAESSVQQRGRTDAESEVMIQMPGVDDPARVKQIISTAAMLELTEVKDGPFPSVEAAMSKHGGVLPLNTRLVRAQSRPGEQGDSFYLLARTPVVTGRDLRNARPGRGESGRWETDFTLSQEAAQRHPPVVDFRDAAQ